MGEDEKLVERVATAIFSEAGGSVDTDWTCYVHEARAAIAAVRAHDAERGLVLVPREPTEAMLVAALPLATEPPDAAAKRIAAGAVMALGTPDRAVQAGVECGAELVRDYRAMIRAAPTQREQGEG